MPEKEGGFFNVNVLEVIILAGMVFGFGVTYAEMKYQQTENKDAIVEVGKKTEDFRKRVDTFIGHVESQLTRERQIDKDCPRHRHGKGGQVFYCGQEYGAPQSLSGQDNDPPIVPAEVSPKKPE
jgi:hypothetical protein